MKENVRRTFVFSGVKQSEKKCLFQFVKPSEQIFFVVLFFSDTFSESDWNFFSIIFLNSSDKRNERNYEEKKILQRNIFHSVFYKLKKNYGKTFSHRKQSKKKKISWIFFLDGFHFWSIWNILKNKIFWICFFHLASHSKTNHIFIDENW